MTLGLAELVGIAPPVEGSLKRNIPVEAMKHLDSWEKVGTKVQVCPCQAYLEMFQDDCVLANVPSIRCEFVSMPLGPM